MRANYNDLQQARRRRDARQGRQQPRNWCAVKQLQTFHPWSVVVIRVLGANAFRFSFPFRKLKLKIKKVADYSAQAVINTILSQAFPEDPIVGEEDATDLRKPDNEDDDEPGQALLRARVVQLADDILAQPPRPPSSSSSSLSSSSSPDSTDIAADVVGGEGERAEWGLGRRWGVDALLKAIDRGNHAGGRSGRASRFSFFLFFLSFD
jgi:hypothetical protein